ncbi:MAG: hypothetical protein IKA32_05150 [Lentisphaeria bacterium]|nr:hypothetical protein [Lentisphaeria bacterium]
MLSLKRFFLLLTAAAGVVVCAQELTVPADLKGWRISGKVTADKEVKLSKNYSLLLENNSWARKEVVLEKGKQYLLKFSVKGENLDKGARIILNSPGVKRWYPVSTRSDKLQDKGTFDWKSGSGLLDPAVLGGTKVVLEFKNYGKGRVWFDKITLDEVNTKLPGNWKNHYGTAVFMDKETKLSDQSIRLNGQGRVEKLFDLEDDAEYELTFYMKGENVSKGSKNGAQVLICGGDRKAWARAATNNKGTPEYGTFDWKKGSRRFTGKYFKSNKVYIMLTLNGSGTVWFDKVELKKLGSLKPKGSFRNINSREIKSFAFYPGGVSGFFKPGEKITFHLELEGKGDYNCLISVKNYSTGKNICKPLSGRIKATGRAEFSLPGQKNGYYTAEATLFQNKKKIGTVQCGLIVAPEFSKRDPFFQFGFGVYPELHDAFKRTGAGAVIIKFKSMEMEQGDPVKYVDRQLNASRVFLDSGEFKLGFSIGATLRQLSDPQAVSAGKPVLTDKHVDNIIKGLTHAAIQTKGKVREWSIGSEIPSAATIPRYVGTWSEAMYHSMVITRMASRIGKKIDPELKVFWGGNNIQRYTESIDRIVFGDLAKDVDGYFIDAYTGNWDMTKGGYSIPERSLRSFYKEASELSESMGKGTAIKNDETGYSINYGSRYDSGLALIQAELTARTIILTRAADVICFELHMPAYHAIWKLRNVKDSDGWMTTIWKPVISKSSIKDVPLIGGAAYTTAARHLSFAKISREIVSGLNYACIFVKPDGKTLCAVWNTEGKVSLSLDLPQDVAATDMTGFEFSLKKGQNKLNISTAPVYLESRVSPAVFEKLLKKAFAGATPPLKIAAKRHSLTQTTLFVQNPGGDLTDIEIASKGKLLKKAKASPGMSTHIVPLANSYEISANGKTYSVKPDNSFIFVKRLARKPVFDGSGSYLEGITACKLRVPSDVYPREALQPERAYFKSSFNPKGHNFSADYFLTYDEENLYIAVKADDKEHLNKVVNGYLWEGDSIQWVLSEKDIPPADIRPGNMKQRDCISEHNYGLGLTERGTEYYKYLGKSGRKSYPCRITRKNGITFYEAALPWRDLGFSPGSGKAIRFSLVVFDKARVSDKSSSYCLAVTQGVSGGMDAGFYRLLVFDK